MFTFENRVGRLCELRVAGLLEPADMPNFRASAAKLMIQHPGKVVFCTDLRALDVLPADTFDALVTMLRMDNPKIERNGILVSDRAVLRMQMQRLIHEAGSVARRVVRTENELRTFLTDSLTTSELARFTEFVREGVSLIPSV